MGDSKTPRIPPGARPRDGAPPRAAATGVTGRFERPAIVRGPSRHGAITRTLSNYANYKRWAEKITANWDPPEDPKV
jgi:hypothetical protein